MAHRTPSYLTRNLPLQRSQRSTSWAPGHHGRVGDSFNHQVHPSPSGSSTGPVWGASMAPLSIFDQKFGLPQTPRRFLVLQQRQVLQGRFPRRQDEFAIKTPSRTGLFCPKINRRMQRVFHSQLWETTPFGSSGRRGIPSHWLSPKAVRRGHSPPTRSPRDSFSKVRIPWL